FVAVYAVLLFHADRECLFKRGNRKRQNNAVITEYDASVVVARLAGVNNVYLVVADNFYYKTVGAGKLIPFYYWTVFPFHLSAVNDKVFYVGIACLFPNPKRSCVAPHSFGCFSPFLVNGKSVNGGGTAYYIPAFFRGFVIESSVTHTCKKECAGFVYYAVFN